MKIERLIESNIKKRIKDVKILIIFGSYARGDFKKSSDIDVLLITEKKRGVKRLERKLSVS